MPSPTVPFSRPVIQEEDIAAVVAVLRSGHLSMGAVTAQFEEELARRVGTKHAVAVANGTAALHLALLASQLQPGDEVITTPFTYVATVNAIVHAGGTPVFVDIDANNLNLDLKKALAALTGRTKAIVPVDVFGRPADLEDLERLASERNLALIEDSCEALGSRHRKRACGSFGLAGALGFAPNKQITTAEGGALLTNHDHVADFARSMRRQGRSTANPEEGYIHAGYNYRPSDIHAALGLAQVRRLDEHLSGRQAAAKHYRHHLADVPEITLPTPDVPGNETSWFVWVIQLERRYAGERRDQVLRALNQRGIGAVHYFPALHLQPFLRSRLGHRPGDFPVTEDVAARAIALPFFPGITEEQILAVKAALLEELARGRSMVTVR